MSEDLKFTPLFKKENLLKKRIGAFSIDLFAVIFATKGMLVSYSLFIKKFALPVYMQAQSDWFNAYNKMEVSALLITFISYFFLCLYLSQGKTLGKTIMGLKVIAKNNPGELYWWEAFARSFSYLTCYMTGLFLFMIPVLNPSQKGLPDWISGTQVISDEEWKQAEFFIRSQNDLKTKKFQTLELLITGHEDLAA